MSLISDSTSHKREISKSKSIHDNNALKPNSAGSELRKQGMNKEQKILNEQGHEQKGYISAQQKFKQMISANSNNPPLPAQIQSGRSSQNNDNLEKYKVKKTVNTPAPLSKDKTPSRGVSPNIHYMSKGNQRPKSVLHSRQPSQENISSISGVLQTNQSNYISNNNYNSGGAAQNSSRNNNEKDQSDKRRLTLKNYKNERVKKHSSSQNESLEIKDLKREESLKKLQQLEVQVLSSKNEQFGIQSSLSKNNSYLQLKNISSNLMISAQKNKSANKNSSANKSSDFNLNVQTDQSTRNKFSKIEKLAEVKSFLFEGSLESNRIQNKKVNAQNKSIVYSSKENINIKQTPNDQKNSSYYPQQQQQLMSINNQAPVKQKSFSLYQANNQQTLGFNSLSTSTNNKSSQNNIQKRNQPQENNSNSSSSKYLLQPKQDNNQHSTRDRGEQYNNNINTNKYKNQSIEKQKTEEDRSISYNQQQQQKQIVLQNKKTGGNNSNNNNINVNNNNFSNSNIQQNNSNSKSNNQIFSQEHNNQYPPQIQHIPPVFMGVNIGISQQPSQSQYNMIQQKSSNVINSGNSSNKAYYYNEKYLSDSQRKREISSHSQNKSPSVVQSNKASKINSNVNNNNNGIGFSQLSSKSVTPDPATRNRNKLDSNRSSMHIIRNLDASNNKPSESIFRINNPKSNNNSSYNSNTNILPPSNMSNNYHSHDKSSERLLYQPTQSANTNPQVGDLSKRNSNSYLRKSVNGGLPLAQQSVSQQQPEQQMFRQNSKSFHVSRQKMERQRSIEISQQVTADNLKEQQQQIASQRVYDAQQDQDLENNGQQPQQLLQKNQSSLSELRLRRIRQANASNGRLNPKLPVMNQQQQNTEPSENEKKIKSIKRISKPNLSMNKIIDNKSGQLKEETKRRIQEIIEKQNKSKKMFGGQNVSMILQKQQLVQQQREQNEITNTEENNLVYSKGVMVTEELRDQNEDQLYGGNMDQEKEIKGYIKGLMDVLKNISSAKKGGQNFPSSKNSPVRKIKMKKRDSISILSSLNQSQFNSANSSLDRKKQGIEPLSNRKLQNRLSASKQYDQQKFEGLPIIQKEAYDSLTKGRLSDRKQIPSSIQKQLDYEGMNQQGNNLSPVIVGKRGRNENDAFEGIPPSKMDIDYQPLIQMSVSKKEYNPHNYSYPEPNNNQIMHEGKEMSIKKMQLSSITNFQVSQKKDLMKKELYYENSSPVKSIRLGNDSQKLSLNDLNSEQQNTHHENKLQDTPALIPIAAQIQSGENSSNYYYFGESIPATINKINSVAHSISEDKSPLPYLQKSVDAANINRGSYLQKIPNEYSHQSAMIAPISEKRSASTHRILGREKPIGESRSMRLNTSSKERSATIHHGGEEIPVANEGTNEDGEQLGVFRTDSKNEVLLKVKRGRSVIKTINPYKSAEKISSNLRRSNDKNSNSKLGLSQNRCTSEPRGVMQGKLPSAAALNTNNQEEASIQTSQRHYQIQPGYTTREHRTISVPTDNQFKSLSNNNYNRYIYNSSSLREQDQEEESKQELYSQIPLLPKQSNNDSIQQNQLLPLKKETQVSFGYRDQSEKENFTRNSSQGKSTHQKKWIEQISSNITEPSLERLQQNLDSKGLSQESASQMQLKNKKPLQQNSSNQKVIINEMQHQKLVGSSSYSSNISPYISNQNISNLQGGNAVAAIQQRKDTELTELVELLEDEQLDQQTWKKKSSRKGSVAAIHFTPSKRNVTYQSHKTAHCSFIDDNETVRTEVIGPINQSQLLFQDENEHEVSQITPKYQNNFKSRNSFLSSDLLSDLNMRRSNQYLHGVHKLPPSHLLLQNPSFLQNSVLQQQNIPHYQPSPLKQQKELLHQQIQHQQQLDSLQVGQAIRSGNRSNSQHSTQFNNNNFNSQGKERTPISLAINQNSEPIQQEGAYQGYDYNPEYEIQKNQFDNHLGNQLSYRSRGYYKKPPTHRVYKSRGNAEEINTQPQNSNNTSSNHQRIHSTHIPEEQLLKQTPPQQLLSQQIELQQHQFQQYQPEPLEKQNHSNKLVVKEKNELVFENQHQPLPSNENQIRQKRDVNQIVTTNPYIQPQQRNINNNVMNYNNNYPYNQNEEYNSKTYKANTNHYAYQNNLNEESNEERILDLLLLDTHELKDKFKEQLTKNKQKTEINPTNYKEIVKSLPVPPELPPNKNIFSEYNQKIFSYDRNIM